MVISHASALVYFCFMIAMAALSEEWKKLGNTFGGSGESGDIPDDVNAIISGSLAAAAVRCIYCCS